MRTFPRFIVSVLFFVIPVHFFAQVDSATADGKYRYEGGLNMYSLLWKISSYQPKNNIKQYFGEGIYWKIYRKRNALRLSLSYINTNYKATEYYYGGYMLEGDLTSSFAPTSNYSINHYTAGQICVGFQHLHSLKKFSLYYASDLFYSYTSERVSFSYGSPNAAYTIDDRFHLFGISEMLGFRMVLHPRVVVNIETGLRLHFVKKAEHNIIIGHDQGGVWWYPLNISMAIRFGKLKS